MKVSVCVARMATPSMAPVSACSPLGTSSASTGHARLLTSCAMSRHSPSRGRDAPMPNRPSMTRCHGAAPTAADAVDVVASIRRAALLRARLRACSRSGEVACASGASHISTSVPLPARCAAASSASPPLSPGPASTSTRRWPASSPSSWACSSFRAALAAAWPARCISSPCGRSRMAACSMARSSAMEYSGVAESIRGMERVPLVSMPST